MTRFTNAFPWLGSPFTRWIHVGLDWSDEEYSRGQKETLISPRIPALQPYVSLAWPLLAVDFGHGGSSRRYGSMEVYMIRRSNAGRLKESILLGYLYPPPIQTRCLEWGPQSSPSKPGFHSPSSSLSTPSIYRSRHHLIHNETPPHHRPARLRSSRSFSRRPRRELCQLM